MTYSDKLNSPHWQKKRLEILSRDEFTCQYCFDKDTQLQIHHLKYKGIKPEETPDEYLVTLCKDCHAVTEFFKNTCVIIRTIKQTCIYGKLIFAACDDLKVRLFIIPIGGSVHFFSQVDTEIIKF